MLPSSCGRDLLPSQDPYAHYKRWEQAVIPTNSHFKPQPQLCHAQPLLSLHQPLRAHPGGNPSSFMFSEPQNALSGEAGALGPSLSLPPPCSRVPGQVFAPLWIPFLYLSGVYSSEMRPEGRPWALGLDLRIRAQGGVGTTMGS